MAMSTLALIFVQVLLFQGMVHLPSFDLSMVHLHPSHQGTAD